MVEQIFVHPKVEKKLEQMNKLENAPFIASKRAGEIIQSFLKGERPSRAGRLSKTKDARIDNLYKFNLGSGYRLICIKEKFNIYILFVGSHDNCDTWLDKHRTKKPHKKELAMKVYDVKISQLAEPKEVKPEIEIDRYNMPEISQKALRKVFKGLFENQ